MCVIAMLCQLHTNTDIKQITDINKSSTQKKLYFYALIINQLTHTNNYLMPFRGLYLGSNPKEQHEHTNYKPCRHNGQTASGTQ